MAKAAAKKTPASPGVFDVSKPGTARPDASSKPIIVTNRPMLHDPMVAAAADATDDKVALAPKSAVTITPITVTSPDEADAAAVTVDKKAESATQAPPLTAESKPKKITKKSKPAPAELPTVKAEDAATSEPSVPAADKPAEESKGEAPTAEPDKAPAPVEEPEKSAEKPAEAAPVADADKPAENEEKAKKALSPEEQAAADKKAAEAAAEHEAAIQKLVDDETYFLPINSVETRKTRRFMLLGVVLILVLALAWADVALDAGLIHLAGLKPLTHLFTN